MRLNNGHNGIADNAYQAAGGDPLLALLLVLDLIWAGRIRVGTGRAATVVRAAA